MAPPDDSGQDDALSVQKIEEQLLQSARQNRGVELQPEQALLVAAVIHKRSFSGPMPPPELLQRYEEIIPGFAKALLVEIQEQGALSRELQRTDLLKDHRRADIGQVFTLVISLSAVGSAVCLGLAGANLPGSRLSLSPQALEA